MEHEPAFPRPHSEGTDGNQNPVIAEAHPGMSLRDYFAARALEAIIVRGDIPDRATIAATAYALADAMIETRSGKADTSPAIPTPETDAK